MGTVKRLLDQTDEELGPLMSAARKVLFNAYMRAAGKSPDKYTEDEKRALIHRHDVALEFQLGQMRAILRACIVHGARVNEARGSEELITTDDPHDLKKAIEHAKSRQEDLR